MTVDSKNYRHSVDVGKYDCLIQRKKCFHPEKFPKQLGKLPETPTTFSG